MRDYFLIFLKNLKLVLSYCNNNKIVVSSKKKPQDSTRKV